MKKYWDIICGSITGFLLAFLTDFKLDRVQLCYSIIILMLACIGAFRIIKQAIEKAHDEKVRSPTFVDNMVDSQPPLKASRIAEAPTKMGEELGKKIIHLWRETKRIMGKIKEFFDKFKGYMLAFALAVLTGIEMYGGFINDIFGGVLTIKGISVLPMVTLVATLVVGMISNGYTKEQHDKIKALFSKSTTNELVLVEIKKNVKEKSAQRSEFNKILTTQEHELANFESELETLNNTLSAKKEMFTMIPQLATGEDVHLAEAEVNACRERITAKKIDIEKTKTKIAELTTAINSLKSQLI